jgi:hypothetical protein
MEITTTREFFDYYEKVRQRTLKVIACIPQEKFDWRYAEDKFSFADVIRHLAAIERYMYGENVQLKPAAIPATAKSWPMGQRMFWPSSIICIKSPWRFSAGSPLRTCKRSASRLAERPLPYGNGCEPWWSMRCIIVRKSMFTWACWGFQRRRFMA